MSNFVKRFFTSILLLIIFYCAAINKIVLFSLLVILGFISLIEFFKLIQKIFADNKIKILFFYLTFIFYLSISLTQIFYYLNLDFRSKLLLIFIISICIATDIGGYIFGKLLKGKRLTKISPNKTYSGLIGSYILSFLIFYYFYSRFNFSTNYLILTFIICSVSQIGDLFISYLKRKAKVKNTGSLLPGHGGILDRIDGIIFAVPVGINLLFIF